jgi:hypothetical protein
MAGIYACKCKGKSTVMSMHVASAKRHHDSTNKSPLCFQVWIKLRPVKEEEKWKEMQSKRAIW